MLEFIIERENDLKIDVAVFKNLKYSSTRRVVQTDKDGNKYIQVPNIYNATSFIYQNSFFDRIEDAVKTVLDGNADALIKGNGLFDEDDTLYPIYFIDREIGNEYRRKTIEEWRDTKFKYSIKISLNYSLLTVQICENLDSCSFINPDKNKIKYFDIFDDAQKFIDNATKTVSKWAKEYLEIGPDDGEIEDKYPEIAEKHYKFLSDHDIDKCLNHALFINAIDQDEEPYHVYVAQCVYKEEN